MVTVSLGKSLCTIISLLYLMWHICTITKNNNFKQSFCIFVSWSLPHTTYFVHSRLLRIFNFVYLYISGVVWSLFLFNEIIDNAMFFDQGYNDSQSLAFSHDFKHNVRLHHQMSRRHVNKEILRSWNINPMITRNTNQNAIYTFQQI